MKIENLLREIWLSITQLKKYARLYKTIVRSQPAQYSEHLPHNSVIWRYIHIPAVTVNKELHLAEDIYCRPVVLNLGFANPQGFLGRFPGVLRWQLSFQVLLFFNIVYQRIMCADWKLRVDFA